MASPLIEEYGRKLLPHLVFAAQAGKLVTYGELESKTGIHHRVVPRALGYIRDEITDPRRLPPINAIVVNQDTRRPGDNWLPGGTSHLTPEENEHEFQKFRDRVFSYDKGWDSLLRELELEPIDASQEDLDERGRTYAQILERTGAGEGEDHLRLKEYIAQHPAVIGLEADNTGSTEYPFIAGDRADVVFATGPDCWTIAEVKNGETGELVRGVYQLVKYRALLAAETGHGRPVDVDAVLAAYKIPSEVSLFAAKFGIRCKIIRRENMMRE